MRVALALGVFLAGPAASPDLERDLAAAHERALEDEHDAAAGLYRSLIERGAGSADVYYNLGTVEASAGRVVEGIVALERALALDPAHRDARANLQALRARLPQPAEEAAPDAPVTFADAVEPWVAGFDRTFAAWLLVGAEVLLFLALWLRRLSVNRAGWTALAVVALLVMTVEGAITLGHVALSTSGRAVATQAAKVRSGPDERFDATAELVAGARVRVLNARGGFVEVQQADGTTGWVRRSVITRF